MTTAELLAALAQEYPNGVSFDPMAVRLLRQKVSIEDSQIEDMKAAMIQLASGQWFSPEMILDNDSRLAFEEQAIEWLVAHGCFSVERLFSDFYSLFNHVVELEDCAAFLRHLGLTVARWGKSGQFCSDPPTTLGDSLAAISKTIAGWIEDEDGTLTINRIEQELPHLTAEALDSIRMRFLPDVHVVVVGGVPCWRSAEAIHLPADFSERLTAAVDSLVAMKESVSVAHLEFALNLFYRVRFRQEYSLTDGDTFIDLCVKHYRGANNLFPNRKRPRAKANDCPPQRRRARGPNKRFGDLGVPIGARLVFTKDNHITCTVLDDSNQVEYEGKKWAISGLAKHLLDVSRVNGFGRFSYEGETLKERHSRLNREDIGDEYQAKEMKQRAQVQGAESGIIGLGECRLSPSTWRMYRSAGTDPRVARWARRVENGESVENIASESGLMVSTVKVFIGNLHRYYAICEKNGILPEGGMDV